MTVNLSSFFLLYYAVVHFLSPDFSILVFIHPLGLQATVIKNAVTGTRTFPLPKFTFIPRKCSSPNIRRTKKVLKISKLKRVE